MKFTRVVVAAFSICVLLSFLIGIFLLINVKAIPQYIRMIDTGKQVLESVLEIRLHEKNYLLHHKEDSLDSVKNEISTLRKLHSFYEKSTLPQERADLLGLSAWEEAVNLYERLFDQFVLYRKAIEKKIVEIRNLEKSILAVIYSKMNPERGIIALQEVRIHEKGYLLYRGYPEPPDERSFQDMRREAVSNLLMWAHGDKRIEELMEKDDQLFSEIINNYEAQDNTLLALRNESGKVYDIGKRFSEEGNKALKIASRRCTFLSITLLIMWLIMAVALVAARFSR